MARYKLKHLLISILVIVASSSCGQSTTRKIRNTQQANILHAQSLAIIDNDIVEAERLLKEALRADPYHFTAHNNLGTIHLESDQLADAAEHFLTASKLVSGDPDPHVNLAITLYRAGRFQEALDEVNIAEEMSPDYLPMLQTRCYILLREDRRDEVRLHDLHSISLRSPYPRWQSWAREWIDKISRDPNMTHNLANKKEDES